jgi:hypothetical protein
MTDSPTAMPAGHGGYFVRGRRRAAGGGQQRLEFGRIPASEIEAPILLLVRVVVNLG